jgi:hypothetical protein
MEIRDHPTAPRSPWQNGHVGWLMGSIRRESLDHIIEFGEAHFHAVLKDYASIFAIGESLDGWRVHHTDNRRALLLFSS